MQQHPPIAVPSVLNTSTVISVDDGLLRISAGCAGPSFSSTLYVGCPNLTVGAGELIIEITSY